MIIGVVASLLLAVAHSAPVPGYLHDLDLFSHEPLLAPAPIIKTLAPAPIFKTLAPAPIFAPAPIIKAAPVFAPAPVIKAVAPAATSYATVTTYNIAHAPVVKTLVAATPILKTYDSLYH